MDEKQKRKYRLFGIINPIDVLIIAAIVGVVWGAYIFSMPQTTVAEGGQTVRFTIEFFDRPEGFHQTIQPGYAVVDSVRGLHIGYIVDAFGDVYLHDVADEELGIFRRVPVPGRESTFVVVEAPANVTDYATEIGHFQVRVNMQIFIRSMHIGGGGIVTDLQIR